MIRVAKETHPVAKLTREDRVKANAKYVKPTRRKSKK
jgi:hypothetical protein